MLLEGWSLGVLLTNVALSFLAGILAAEVRSLALRRRVTSLEYEVSDLEGRLLREVKMRAGKEGVKARKQEEELFEQIVNKPPEPAAPWWMPYVSKDLRQ